MRRVTREVAFEGGWSPGRAARVRELFDNLAEVWHTKGGPERRLVVGDALERGGPWTGPAVEVGSGTGHHTAALQERFGTVVAVDISGEMLRRAPAGVGHRVCADAARLPLPDGSMGAVVLINALLFPAEVARVLSPEGAVVWVNTRGDRTPIHLSAEEVVAALGPGWTAVASTAGWGTWAVARRA